MFASHAESGKVYSICVEENGQEKYVKAEFSTRGRKEFSNLIFFRRQVEGKTLIHGIQATDQISEMGRIYREQD